MLPLYIDQFFKNIIFLGLTLLLSFLGHPGIVFAQTTPSMEMSPGLAYSIEYLLNKSLEMHEETFNHLSKNPLKKESLKNLKSIKINPQFLTTLLLYSNHRYLQLAQLGECSFYSLMQNNLLKIGQEPISHLIIDYLNTENKEESGVIVFQEYLDFIYEKKCLQNKEIETLFTLKQFSNVINKLTFPVPEDLNQCTEILKQWVQNPYTPYICKLSEIFQNAKIYSEKLSRSKGANQPNQKAIDYISFAKDIRQKLSTFQYIYINNMCQNLQDSQQFCNRYLSQSIWSKVINGERPASPIKYRCQDLMKKKNLTKANYEQCIKRLENDPQQCHYLNQGEFKALVPKPNCQSISQALLHSQLQGQYQDCPGSIRHEGLVSVNRIINHLDLTTEDSTTQLCQSAPAHTFTKLIEQYGQPRLWQSRICYYDFSEEDNLCLPFILGEHPRSEKSENVVVGKILTKTHGLGENVKCKIISGKEYKPHLLEFKRGCFLTYNQSKCTTLDCPKKIILNEKEVTNLNYHMGAHFYYFPLKINELSKSSSFIIDQVYKTKSLQIKNLTQLKTALSQNKRKNIVHGVGCIENLFPSFFKSKVLNQCHPTSFIIDGLFEENLTSFIVMRTSLDENNSPRILSWNSIYSALKNYQELHPLKSWNLYVIQK